MAAVKDDHDLYDDESPFDEEYFTRTYQPLSNLPTPPPSCRESVASLSPRYSIHPDELLLESILLGPAVHLANLIPPTASVATPSVPAVHEILTRANLPSETVALAVCILDSLNAKFSHNWRQACPLARREAATAPAKPAQLHIDSVPPEVIILASLIAAVKFLDDFQEPTRQYAANWGNDAWNCDQINVTERCIMESLGYRIMPLWNPDLIKGAVADMERASISNPGRDRFGSVVSTTQVISHRKAITSPTPTEAPKFDAVAWGSDAGDVRLATRALQDDCIEGPTSGFTIGPPPQLPHEGKRLC